MRIVAVLILLSGCGKSVECGEGTELVDGKCVPAKEKRAPWKCLPSKDGVVTATLAPKSGAPVLLIVRRRPSKADEASIGLTSGKFECTGACTISAKFDDQPAKELKVNPVTTGQRLEIQDESAWLMALNTAKRLTL